MKKSLKTAFVASLTAFVLLGFAMAPAAEAARGGGGGARAAGGGGGASRQVSNTSRDARANNVRNTSVNNVNSSRNVSRDVNVDRDVNIDVDVDHGHGGWDHDYHPVATAAVIAGTAAIIGSIVYSIPPSCVPINYGGMIYQQCGSTWYQPQGTQYIVVNPPY
jgi:hypothetical protein